MQSDGDAMTYQHLNESCVYGLNIRRRMWKLLFGKAWNTFKVQIERVRNKGDKDWWMQTWQFERKNYSKITKLLPKSYKGQCFRHWKKRNRLFLHSLCITVCLPTKSHHNKCPVGANSWCFYQLAMAYNEKTKSHDAIKTHLSKNVVAYKLPVYQRLASNDIVQLCVSAKTQTSNETFHSCIWQNSPKEVFVSKIRLEIAVKSA